MKRLRQTHYKVVLFIFHLNIWLQSFIMCSLPQSHRSSLTGFTFNFLEILKKILPEVLLVAVVRCSVRQIMTMNHTILFFISKKPFSKVKIEKSIC